MFGYDAQPRCMFIHQHRMGLCLQIRSDEDCAELWKLLEAILGVRSIVALVVDLDHGGSAVVRREMITEAVRAHVYGRREQEVAL